MKCSQHPAEVFSSYWVPSALVHILEEINETAKHHLDFLTCNDVSNNQDAGDPADIEEAQGWTLTFSGQGPTGLLTFKI